LTGNNQSFVAGLQPAGLDETKSIYRNPDHFDPERSRYRLLGERRLLDGWYIRRLLNVAKLNKWGHQSLAALFFESNLCFWPKAAIRDPEISGS